MSDRQDEDRDLVRQCKHGSLHAFEILFNKYYQKILNKCHCMLKSAMDAEDVAQETFLKAYEKINSFEGRSSFFTWLYSIADNQCKNRLRITNIRTVNGLSDKSNPGNSSSNNPTKAKETADCVRQKIGMLDDIFRSALELVHLQELTYEEAADILECPVGTIKARVSRAMDHIEPLLKECL